MTELCLAVDTSDVNKAWFWCDETKHYIDMIKIGLEFFTVHGKSGYSVLQQFNKPIFLDLKLYDIPNTVYNTVKYLCLLHPRMISVHWKCVESAVRARGGSPDTLILATTVLSSDAGTKWMRLWRTYKRAKYAIKKGSHGIICPAPTVKWMRKWFPDTLIVVPGIRFYDVITSDDQISIGTPSRVAKDGADVIVVGRTITNYSYPSHMADIIKYMIREVY